MHRALWFPRSDALWIWSGLLWCCDGDVWLIAYLCSCQRVISCTSRWYLRTFWELQIVEWDHKNSRASSWLPYERHSLGRSFEFTWVTTQDRIDLQRSSQDFCEVWFTCPLALTWCRGPSDFSSCTLRASWWLQILPVERWWKGPIMHHNIFCTKLLQAC